MTIGSSKRSESYENMMNKLPPTDSSQTSTTRMNDLSSLLSPRKSGKDNKKESDKSSGYFKEYQLSGGKIVNEDLNQRDWDMMQESTRQLHKSMIVINDSNQAIT